MTADLLALRRVPAAFYGVFMRINPVFAALTGRTVLGQPLQLADWLAIGVIPPAALLRRHRRAVGGVGDDADR
jgi:inner membrane transporter RhtA